MENRVPELSLADFTHGDAGRRARFCDEAFRGLTRYGFIILRDHPVSNALLDEAYRLSAAFFAQVTAAKMSYANGVRGYTTFRTEHAKNHAIPDLTAFWQLGPEAGVDGDYLQPPNVWPDAPPRFR